MHTQISQKTLFQMPKSAYGYTLEEIIERYLLDCYVGELQPRTIQSYDENLRRWRIWLEEHLNCVHITGVTADAMRAFLGQLRARGRTPHTVDKYRRTINAFLNWCVLQSKVPLNRNPLDEVRRPTLPKRKVPRLTLEQFHRLLHEVNETKYPYRNRALILLMGDSGLRCGEVVGLSLKDIHLDEGEVHVIGKGNKERTAPLGSDTIRAITEWLQRRPEVDHKALFTTRDKVRITQNAIRLMLRKLGEALGFERLYPHLLRHTFANLFLTSDTGDLRSLQKILGHEDVETTAMIYTDPNIDDLKAKHSKSSPMNQSRRD